jgi:tRNA U55 pseudouridine synthase TruB
MLTVFKPFGMTPKELVDEYVKIRGAKKGAFSGRLDPMACGVMKIYFDDDCKLANVDDKLNKTYRFVMIFGIGSTSQSIDTDPWKHRDDVWGLGSLLISQNMMILSI